MSYNSANIVANTQESRKRHIRSSIVSLLGNRENIPNSHPLTHTHTHTQTPKSENDKNKSQIYTIHTNEIGTNG